MSNYISRNSLKHYGISGMKWGVRRFQNPDGTYTEEGKKRRQIAENAFKQGKDGKPSRAEKLTRSSSEIVNSAQNLRKNTRNKVVNEKVKQKTKDISKMSNQELQAKITRYNLEQQYKDVIRKESEIEAGSNKVDEFLSVAGNTLAIATSAATLFTMLWQIKNGK